LISPFYTAKITNISGFIEATNKMVRFSETPRVFDGATLFVCPSGRAWCGPAGATRLAELTLEGALVSAPIVNGETELAMPIVLSMREMYFEAMSSWVIRFAGGERAWMEKPTSPEGDFIAKDSLGNEIVMWAVLPDLTGHTVAILPPTPAEKAAFQRGEILPVRDTLVMIDFSKIENGAYAVEMVNPAANFDVKPPARYLLTPGAFEGARLCAAISAVGEAAFVFTAKAAPAPPIPTFSPPTRALAPGQTAREGLVVIKFADETRAWGEAPPGDFLIHGPTGDFLRWVESPPDILPPS
jgi:hypothetical protein